MLVVKMYVDSPAARSILQKSIVQEFEISKRKMVQFSFIYQLMNVNHIACVQECVLINCVDPGQSQREIDQLLQSISRTIASELNA